MSTWWQSRPDPEPAVSPGSCISGWSARRDCAIGILRALPSVTIRRNLRRPWQQHPGRSHDTGSCRLRMAGTREAYRGYCPEAPGTLRHRQQCSAGHVILRAEGRYRPIIPVLRDYDTGVSIRTSAGDRLIVLASTASSPWSTKVTSRCARSGRCQRSNHAAPRPDHRAAGATGPDRPRPCRRTLRHRPRPLQPGDGVDEHSAAGVVDR